MRVKQLLLLSSAFLALSTTSVLAQGEAGNASSATVTINNKFNVATYYDNRSFIVPEGLTGYIVRNHGLNEKGNRVIVADKWYTSGEIVPANTGVILRGSKNGNYTLQYTEKEGKEAVDNFLRGSVTKETVNGGQIYYMLTEFTDEEHVVFKRLESTAENQANRAYVAIPINTITIGSLGVSTYYNSSSYKLPEGLNAGVVRNYGRLKGQENRDLKIQYIYKNNAVIPDSTGVILNGKPGKYALEAVYSEEESPKDNFLRGSDAAAPLEGSNADIYYQLTGNNGSVYFQRLKPTALNNANKAYVAIPTFEISVSQVGVSSFYDGEAYQLPEGLEGGIVKTNKTELDKPIEVTAYYDYKADDVIPAATGVLLRGEEGKYTLEQVYSEKASPADNELRGSEVKEMTKGNEGDVFYGMFANKEMNGVVFRYVNEGGAAFENTAHKAYLATPKHNAASNGVSEVSLKFADNTVSGIEGVQTNNTTSNAIYRIDGTRVQAENIDDLPSGIYIVNGKKIIK